MYELLRVSTCQSFIVLLSLLVQRLAEMVEWLRDRGQMVRLPWIVWSAFWNTHVKGCLAVFLTLPLYVPAVF